MLPQVIFPEVWKIAKRGCKTPRKPDPYIFLTQSVNYLNGPLRAGKKNFWKRSAVLETNSLVSVRKVDSTTNKEDY